MTAETAAGSSPLAGVNVVDFGHWVAGPYVAQTLSALGATVVKVERFEGDPLSRSPTGPHSVVNRGKLSLALDLKVSGADSVVCRLVTWADVVVHNYRPGVADRIGIGKRRIEEIDPTVVLVEVSAYGFDGPTSRQPGFDPIFTALAGHAWRAGKAAGRPVCVTRMGPIDCGTGTLGAFAAAVGLYRARRTGAGGTARLSLLGSSLFLMSEVERSPAGALTGSERVGGDQTSDRLAEALYRLADGWVAVVPAGEEARRDLVRRLGLAELASTPSDRWTDADQETIGAAMRSLTRPELTAQLAGIAVSVVPCRPPRSETQDGYASSQAFPVTFEGTEMPFLQQAAAPRLGDNTTDVLRLIGMNSAEIERLHETNVVRQRIQ